MIRARKSRCVVSVCAPRNTTRPAIITQSPTASSRLRPSPGPRAIISGGASAMRLRRTSLLLRRLTQRAVIDIADCDRAAGQRAAEAVGEFQRQAGLERGIDRVEIGGARVRRNA